MHFLKYTHSRPGAESAPSRSRKERGSPGAIAQVVGQSGFPDCPTRRYYTHHFLFELTPTLVGDWVYSMI